MQAKRVQPGRVVLVAILIPLLLLLNSCAVLYNGLNQGIPVSTEPVGVEVYLDGELMGVTPLEIEVRRAQAHELLLRYGVQEKLFLLEPSIQSSGGLGLGLDTIPLVAGFVYGSIFRSGPYSCQSFFDHGTATCHAHYGEGVVLGAGLGITSLFIAIDYVTGAIYTLNPGVISEVFDIVEP